VSNTTSSATVVIYRNSDWNVFDNAVIFANGKKICKLSFRRYITYKAKSGALTINAHPGGFLFLKDETQVGLGVEAGKTYYIACKGIWFHYRHRRQHSKIFEMWEVPESIAKIDLAKLKPDHCMNKD
jgi:hypothetical protein